MGFVLSIKVFVYLFICILFRKMLKAVILYHTTLLHYTMLYYTILLQWLHFIQIFTKFDSPIVLFFFFFFLSRVFFCYFPALFWFWLIPLSDFLSLLCYCPAFLQQKSFCFSALSCPLIFYLILLLIIFEVFRFCFQVMLCCFDLAFFRFNS